MANDIDNELPEGFAEASYGAGKYETFALKPDSTLVVRILPPMKSLIKSRDYGAFWYTHFMKGTDQRNPDKIKTYPVLGIEERDFRKGGIIIKQDPLVEARRPYLDKIDAITASGKEKGLSKEEIRKAVAPYREWLEDHGYSGKWHLYAINKSGQFGILRISNRLMKELRAEVKKLIAREINPMGVKGVFWSFTRTGNGFQDADKVVPNRIVNPGDGSERLDFHTLTAEIGRAALEALPDLEEEKARISYSIEIMEALAKDSSPENVAHLLNRTDSRDQADSNVPAESSRQEDDEIPAGVAASSPTPPQEKAAEPAPAEPTEEDEEAALQAQLAALKAKKAAKAKPVARPAAKPEPPKAPPVDDDGLDSVFES